MTKSLDGCHSLRTGSERVRVLSDIGGLGIMHIEDCPLLGPV